MGGTGCLVTDPMTASSVRAAPLLTAREVGKLLNVPLSSVYAMVKDGVLPAVRLGARRIRIPASSVRVLAERGFIAHPGPALLSPWGGYSG